MESTASIEQLHEELQSWKHELSSFKNEIRSFENHLENMAQKTIPRELLAHVEHFQNSFICQKEVIDRLRHDLPDSRHKVENIFNNIRASGAERTDGHGHLRDRMDTFRKIYHEVRNDFMRFETESV